MASNKVQAFFDLMVPLAVADMKKSGILASVTLAQGILESGWGTSDLAVTAKNYFGMKARLSGNTWTGSTWQGEVYNKETKEQEPDGTVYTIQADFRKYNEVAESVADHSAYLLGAKKGNGLRYAGLKGEKDARTAVTIIKNGGYATDVKYIDKVMNIIEKYTLTQYDGEPEAAKEPEPITLWYRVLLEPGNKIETLRSYPAYNTADAAKKAGGSNLTYPAGEYYVYKVHDGAVNITREKGTAGAWVVL